MHVSKEEKSGLFSKIFFTWPKAYINRILTMQKDNEEFLLSDNLEIPANFNINSIEKKFGDFLFQNNLTVKRLILKIVSVYRKDFIIYFLLGVVPLVFDFVTPIIYPEILKILSSKKALSYDIYNLGIVLLLLFIITQIVGKIVNNIFIHTRWKLIVSIEYFFRSSLFTKLTKISQKGIHSYEGRLINLYSTHVNWMRGIVWACDFIINILGMIGGVILIYKYLGLGGVLGALMLLLATPLISKVLKSLNKMDSKIHEANELRLLTISEVLDKIKEIKIACMGKFFRDKILDAREQQLQHLLRKNKIQIILSVITYTLVPIVTILSLAFSTLLGFNIELSKMLASFIIFGILDKCLNNVIISTDTIRAGLKSMQFVLEYFNRDKTIKKSYEDSINNEITLVDASFGFENEGINTILLDKISLNILPGELVVVTGDTASGKTTLLEALYGKQDLLSGTFCIGSNVTYVPNKPWFLPLSIKKNIILNRIFDEQEYKKCLDLCELNPDINSLIQFDETILNPQTANLSGGQLNRIQLARAIYLKPDIVFLDDIFNSLDFKVRNNIINNLVLGYWKEKTRVVVSSDYSLLSRADKIVVMENNKIIMSGKPCDILDKITYVKNDNSNIENSINTKCENPNSIESNNNEQKVLKGNINVENATGKGRLSIFVNYILSLANTPVFTLLSILFVVYPIFDVASKYLFTRVLEDKNIGILEYSGIYIFVILTLIAITTLKYFIIYTGSIKAGRKLHNKLLDNVIDSKIYFFFNKKAGELIARFSNDIKIIDNDLPRYFIDLIEACIRVAVALILLVYSNYAMAVFVFMFILLFKRIQMGNRITSKISTTLSNKSHEPCISMLKTTMDGLIFIKKQKLEAYVSEEWKKDIVNSLNCEYTRQSLNRYYLQRLDLAGSLIITLFIIMNEFMKFNNNYLLINVSLTYAIMMLTGFDNLLRNLRHAEIGVASLERVEEYNKSEKELASNDINIPQYEFNNGDIIIKELSCKYEKSNYILKSFSLDASSGEKILVTGRTGSGKTTLFNCLMKLIDYEGNIFIGGKNIKNMPIDILRRNILMLTQNPLIFKGTIRENIDPYKQYNDKQIWDALEKINFKSRISSTENKLETKIFSENSFLSSGEQQLICLTRIILAKPKVLLIDEGMSHIDSLLEEKIYRYIWEYLKETTIISISHKESSHELYNQVVNIENYSLLSNA